MRRLVPWIGVLVLAAAGVYGGRYVGHRVERLGPIAAVSAPMTDLLLDAAVASVVAALGVVILYRRQWESVGIATAVGVIGTLIGTYSAFNTIAGSRDCPGTQDCDTLIVPVLAPFLLSCAVAASLVALLAYLAQTRARQ